MHAICAEADNRATPGRSGRADEEDYDMPTPAVEKLILGRPFDLEELVHAVAWPTTLTVPRVRVEVATDHDASPETIEVTPPWSDTPWWSVLKDPAGRFIVTDLRRWVAQGFESIDDALAWIAGGLSEGEQARLE